MKDETIEVETETDALVELGTVSSATRGGLGQELIDGGGGYYR